MMVSSVYVQRQEWGSGVSSVAAMKDCILLAACGADEILPQSAEFPADIFTSCLTTPIKIALRWYYLILRPLITSLLVHVMGNCNL